MTRWSRKARLIGSALAAFAAAAITVAVPALAHHIKSVTIQGQPVVGSTLTAVTVVTDPAAVLEYRWQRCTTDQRISCDRIQNAPNAPTYTVATADLDRRLAVRVLGVVAGDQDSQWSPLTSVVTAPPAPAPAPTPTPTPTPDPDPDAPDDAPTFNQSTGPSLLPLGGPATPADEALRYLRPFPVVRVKGTLVPGGARITLLRVKAPSAATVDARCKGPGCRLRRQSFGSGRVPALERFLRAGTRVTIRVSTEDAVGKYVRLVIRDGSAPKRRDACLLPGDGAPAGCPGA
jgi:hypothetical protein